MVDPISSEHVCQPKPGLARVASGEFPILLKSRTIRDNMNSFEATAKKKRVFQSHWVSKYHEATHVAWGVPLVQAVVVAALPPGLLGWARRS